MWGGIPERRCTHSQLPMWFSAALLKADEFALNSALCQLYKGPVEVNIDVAVLIFTSIGFPYDTRGNHVGSVMLIVARWATGSPYCVSFYMFGIWLSNGTGPRPYAR